MGIFDDIVRLPEFEKDIKNLLKKFKTLEEDLDTLIRTELKLYHKLGIDNNGIFPITGLQIKTPPIYKVKKFACRSLKGKGAKSGIRVIYAHFEEKNSIEFIEIHYKGDKELENRERILKYYK